MRAQLSHFPHDSPVFDGFGQRNSAASACAVVNFPTPAGPAKISPCASRSLRQAFRSVSIDFFWPKMSLKPGIGSSPARIARKLVDHVEVLQQVRDRDDQSAAENDQVDDPKERRLAHDSPFTAATAPPASRPRAPARP